MAKSEDGELVYFGNKDKIPTKVYLPGWLLNRIYDVDMRTEKERDSGLFLSRNDRIVRALKYSVEHYGSG